MVITIGFIKKILHAKSYGLFQHSVSTAEIAALLVVHGKRLNVNLGATVRDAYVGGLIHDIGKLYVSDAILNKHESLSSREWETMKLHPAWGKQIIDETPLAGFLPAVTQHHEMADGKGYPFGLTVEKIAPLAKIVSVADNAAALLENRPYRRSIPEVDLIMGMVGNNVISLLGETGMVVAKNAIGQYMMIRHKHKRKHERQVNVYVKQMIRVKDMDLAELNFIGVPDVKKTDR